MVDPTDRHTTRLERLPQGVEHRWRELTHLIEEQHTAMGEEISPGRTMCDPPPTSAAEDDV